MVWLILVGLALLFIIPDLYSNSGFAKKRREKRELNRPYNSKWIQLVSKLKDAEQYKDWKSQQVLRKELLWLQTIYSYEYSSRSSFKGYDPYGTNETNKKDIKASFKNADLITPEIFSFSNKMHKIFTENIAAQFEQLFSEVNKTDRKLNENPDYNFQLEKDKVFFDENLLPLPKDYIEKALLFQYAFNTEHPEKVFDMQIMRPEYFQELIEKLKNFR